MSDAAQNALLKLFAFLLGIFGLVSMVSGLDADGAFAKLWGVVLGGFIIVTAIGFWMMQGWAFLTVSVGLLLSFLTGVVQLLIAVDRGEGVSSRAMCLGVTILLIAYLGRWSMERKFRPHLDVDQPH